MRNYPVPEDVSFDANAIDVLSTSVRFDLIPKFLLARDLLFLGSPSTTYKNFYLRSIQAFNGFWEIEPRKNGAKDFLREFIHLFESISRHGYDRTYAIPTNGDLNPLEGAHRIAIAAAQNLKIPFRKVQDTEPMVWDWRFFMRQGLSESDADFTATRFVQFASQAQVLIVHACVPLSFDYEIDSIIYQSGCAVFYKRAVNVSFNSYVDLKKINYVYDQFESWAGNSGDGFKGAIRHAEKSFGSYPLRMYILIAEHGQVVSAKQRIRDLVGKGNFSVHSSDSSEESRRLVEAVLNANTRGLTNGIPPDVIHPNFDRALLEVNSFAARNNLKRDEILVTGSLAMSLVTSRVAGDVDVLMGRKLDKEEFQWPIQDHSSQLEFYPAPVIELLRDPKHHMWHRGVMFLSFSALRQVKLMRGEVPKDLTDLALLEDLLKAPGGDGASKYWVKEFRVLRIHMKSKLKAVPRHIWRCFQRYKFARCLRYWLSDTK